MALLVEIKETDECRILRDTAADYAAKVLAPEAEQLDNAWELPPLDSLNKAEGALTTTPFAWPWRRWRWHRRGPRRRS